MANRPIFLPMQSSSSFVNKIGVEFKWHAGMSVSQKQKSIRSLHESAIAQHRVMKPLEISSKSETELGRRLSAFNLIFSDRKWLYGCVETAFQGSKVFEFGGPFTDLYEGTARAAKKDDRIKQSGKLISFKFMDEEWPLKPLTAFYDWLYLNALHQNPQLTEPLLQYDGFTDIEFNPKKSINCQAASAALYVSLRTQGLVEKTLDSSSAYKLLFSNENSEATPIQGKLL
jgi:hypothetical protein